MALLTQQVGKLGQAEVARRLGYSPSAINQVIHGNYKGDATAILTKVEEIFGKTTIICPILGEITLGKCADNRKRPFAATNPIRVRLYRACKTCGGKPHKEENHV
jgi:transcriptional regulator with XRE-family HTH domain